MTKLNKMKKILTTMNKIKRKKRKNKMKIILTMN